MAVLIPAGFEFDSIANRDERCFVSRLAADLSDEWLLLTNVDIHERRDYEIDIVLAHPHHGIMLIEVKGDPGLIRGGKWVSKHDRVDPETQAKNNSYKLRECLRRDGLLPYIEVEWGIALPNVTSLSGGLPSGISKSQLILATDLDQLAETIEVLACHRRIPAFLTPSEFHHAVSTLAPDTDFNQDPRATATSARAQLRRTSDIQTSTLQSLDCHRRVVVTGKAGTGKTYLATRWAQRGAMDDPRTGRPRRVLLTCYNDPLAAAMAECFDPEDPDIVVGSFLRVAMRLEGMEPLEITNEFDNDFWTNVVPGHLIAHWSKITERFDRIIIDEAQDFSPAWIGLLESLLDPDGDQTLMLMVDTSQEIYARGFVVPSIDTGWTSIELEHNVRNTREIARLARLVLGGSAASVSLPESSSVRGVPINGDAEITTAVSFALATFASEGVAPKDTLVLTFSADLRNQLRTKLGLRSFDAKDREAVTCETIHRMKGLEASAIVVVAPSGNVDPVLLYVAITRAVNDLTVVGPRDLLHQLGLT